MNEAASVEFPGLFQHANRTDWGVGVLAGEHEGKRTYLFEDGKERVMGSGALDMMHRIVPLDSDQGSKLARLTALVARRRGLPDSTKTAAVPPLDQLAVWRRAFPGRLADPAWQSEKRAAKARDVLVPKAQRLLASDVLDAQLKAQQFGALWASVALVLSATGWPPADQLKHAPVLGLGLLAGAVRELLYGSAAVAQRVDRFSVAFETAFRFGPRWETTTGLLALVSPESHVLVDVASFRKQLKLLGAKGTLSRKPSGASYVRCLSAARIVGAKLSQQGEMPQDLLDVHDFVRFTLKASSPARRASAVETSNKHSSVARTHEA